MTLSVAVRFPFGRLAAMCRDIPGFTVPGGVILATDSRFTGRGEGSVLTDRGRKLFRIANDAALVYSGDVLAAQAAVRSIRQFFARRALDSPNEATLQVAELVKAAYQRELAEREAGRRNTTVGPLDILVGVCKPGTGETGIFFLSSRSSFKPYLANAGNIAAVGSMGEAARFEERLLALDAEQWERYGPPPLDPGHWQIIVVAAISSVIEAQKASSAVGGPIQTALITGDAYFLHEFSYLEADGDPLVLASWKVATVPYEETELVHREGGRALAEAPAEGSGSREALRSLQNGLGVRFRKPALLRLALTHKSVANEAPAAGQVEHNERLEFLGDAILGAVVADELYRAFPEASEGGLTVMRAELVRESSLASWARRWRLGDYILLGRGEAQSGGAGRDGVLAACFEAVVGAIYLDRGERAVRAALVPLYEEAARELSPSPRASDPKSELQHRVQVATGALPTYRVVSVEGPDHQPQFTVLVDAGRGLSRTGVGRSKQAAEQEAARKALEAWSESRLGPEQQTPEESAWRRSV